MPLLCPPNWRKPRLWRAVSRPPGPPCGAPGEPTSPAPTEAENPLLWGQVRAIVAAVGGLELVMAEATAWADETFPNATAHSRAAHLLKEAKELAAHPTDPAEMADIALLLGHLAAGVGVNLAEAAARKLAVNRARQWGKPDVEGVVEHVREFPLDLIECVDPRPVLDPDQ